MVTKILRIFQVGRLHLLSPAGRSIRIIVPGDYDTVIENKQHTENYLRYFWSL